MDEVWCPDLLVTYYTHIRSICDLFEPKDQAIDYNPLQWVLHELVPLRLVLKGQDSSRARQIRMPIHCRASPMHHIQVISVGLYV